MTQDCHPHQTGARLFSANPVKANAAPLYAALLVGCFAANLFAQANSRESVSIREPFVAGKLYGVSMRVELKGSLHLPQGTASAAKKELTINGRSSIDYDERILKPDSDGSVTKSVRHYKRLNFERTIGGVKEQNQLRPSARRLVILRFKQLEVPFSPDGPLTWDELEMVRTDVFTPALSGFYPIAPVRAGDRWTAAKFAVKELTDLERIDNGSITCKLERLTSLAGRRYARVSFAGVVSGINEDGPCKQQLDGYFYFDLNSSHLSYLSMRGVHHLLDKNGLSKGKVEGSLVLTRQLLRNSDSLSDASLRNVSLKETDQNTRLLYDNPVLGLRFHYPRRWRVAGVKGKQLGLDERGGSGILLTVEPAGTVPTGKRYYQESRQWLEKQKAQIVKVEPVRVLQRYPNWIENFTMDVVASNQQFRMYYVVNRQRDGGGLIAARLMGRDLAGLQRDVQAIVSSIRISKKR